MHLMHRIEKSIVRNTVKSS